MAPNLDTLPVETLSLVLGHFCLHCSKEHGYESPHGYFRCRQNGEEQQADQPSWYSRDYRHTLYSVCLVSKRLASVAQALLHYEFVPGYGDAWRSDQFSWDGRLESFLRTVAARKDLAELMKRIFEHPHLLRAVTEEEAQLTLDEVLGTAPAGPAAGNAQLLSEYLDAFDLLREPRVSFPGPQRHPGWKLVGVLLASAPNLERLSLQVEGTGCVPAAAFSALRGLSVSSAGAVLSQLKTLDFCPRSAWWVFHAKHHATGILEAAATGKSEGSSSLSTLNLHMCGGIGQVKLQGLGSVQALRITLGRLYNGDLSVLLNSCRGGSGLKSFYYEARSPRVWVGHVEGSCNCNAHSSSQFSSLPNQYIPTKTTLAHTFG
ncbi:hypothetical protein N658DRAFT_414625 [Parathielavia hyrcaniae]|uniref:Uncharacterized protein n=1 Tax=Parathielavia hyrcaniae TaxID=113614 RepID=A0AAN6T6C9_9PEZI|nr:hypothetical protein N658DRAFT_414625 [Parathielavia hyrcaniae]